jgi:hypothetical protein
LKALEWNILVYFMNIWCIKWPFGIICGRFGTFFPILV